MRQCQIWHTLCAKFNVLKTNSFSSSHTAFSLLARVQPRPIFPQNKLTLLFRINNLYNVPFLQIMRSVMFQDPRNSARYRCAARTQRGRKGSKGIELLGCFLIFLNPNFLRLHLQFIIKIDNILCMDYK